MHRNKSLGGEHHIFNYLVFTVSFYFHFTSVKYGIKEILSIANYLNPCKEKLLTNHFCLGFTFKLLFEGQGMFHAPF